MSNQGYNFPRPSEVRNLNSWHQQQHGQTQGFLPQPHSSSQQFQYANHYTTNVQNVPNQASPYRGYPTHQEPYRPYNPPREITPSNNVVCTNMPPRPFVPSSSYNWYSQENQVGNQSNQPMQGQGYALHSYQPIQGQGYAPQSHQPIQGQGYSLQSQQPIQGQGYIPQSHQTIQGQEYAPQSHQPSQGQGYTPQAHQPFQGQGYTPNSHQPIHGQGYTPHSHQPIQGQGLASQSHQPIQGQGYTPQSHQPIQGQGFAPQATQNENKNQTYMWQQNTSQNIQSRRNVNIGHGNNISVVVHDQRSQPALEVPRQNSLQHSYTDSKGQTSNYSQTIRTTTLITGNPVNDKKSSYSSELDFVGKSNEKNKIIKDSETNNINDGHHTDISKIRDQHVKRGSSNTGNKKDNREGDQQQFSIKTVLGTSKSNGLSNTEKQLGDLPEKVNHQYKEEAAVCQQSGEHMEIGDPPKSDGPEVQQMKTTRSCPESLGNLIEVKMVDHKKGDKNVKETEGSLVKVKTTRDGKETEGSLLKVKTPNDGKETEEKLTNVNTTVKKNDDNENEDLMKVRATKIATLTNSKPQKVLNKGIYKDISQDMERKDVGSFLQNKNKSQTVIEKEENVKEQVNKQKTEVVEAISNLVQILEKQVNISPKNKEQKDRSKLEVHNKGESEMVTSIDTRNTQTITKDYEIQSESGSQEKTQFRPNEICQQGESGSRDKTRLGPNDNCHHGDHDIGMEHETDAVERVPVSETKKEDTECSSKETEKEVNKTNKSETVNLISDDEDSSPLTEDMWNRNYNRGQSYPDSRALNNPDYYNSRGPNNPNYYNARQERGYHDDRQRHLDRQNSYERRQEYNGQSQYRNNQNFGTRGHDIPHNEYTRRPFYSDSHADHYHGNQGGNYHSENNRRHSDFRHDREMTRSSSYEARDKSSSNNRFYNRSQSSDVSSSRGPGRTHSSNITSSRGSSADSKTGDKQKISDQKEKETKTNEKSSEKSPKIFSPGSNVYESNAYFSAGGTPDIVGENKMPTPTRNLKRSFSDTKRSPNISPKGAGISPVRRKEHSPAALMGASNKPSKGTSPVSKLVFKTSEEESKIQDEHIPSLETLSKLSVYEPDEIESKESSVTGKADSYHTEIDNRLNNDSQKTVRPSGVDDQLKNDAQTQKTESSCEIPVSANFSELSDISDEEIALSQSQSIDEPMTSATENIIIKDKMDLSSMKEVLNEVNDKELCSYEEVQTDEERVREGSPLLDTTIADSMVAKDQEIGDGMNFLSIQTGANKSHASGSSQFKSKKGQGLANPPRSTHTSGGSPKTPGLLSPSLKDSNQKSAFSVVAQLPDITSELTRLQEAQQQNMFRRNSLESTSLYGNQDNVERTPSKTSTGNVYHDGVRRLGSCEKTPQNVHRHASSDGTNVFGSSNTDQQTSRPSKLDASLKSASSYKEWRRLKTLQEAAQKEKEKSQVCLVEKANTPEEYMRLLREEKQKRRIRRSTESSTENAVPDDIDNVMNVESDAHDITEEKDQDESEVETESCHEPLDPETESCQEPLDPETEPCQKPLDPETVPDSLALFKAITDYDSGSEEDIDLEESDDDLEAPSFLFSLEEACNRPVPGTPTKLNYDSPGPCSPTPDVTGDLTDITRSTLQSSKFSLDQLVSERVDKSEDQREYEEIHAKLEEGLKKGGFVKDTLENVEPSEVDILPEHEQHLQEFEVLKSKISEVHPGDVIFQPLLYQRLFNGNLTLQTCGFSPGTSYIDKYLSTLQPKNYNLLLTSKILKNTLENVACVESVLKWLFLLMSIHSNQLVTHGCEETLMEHLSREVHFRQCPQTWAPSIPDILSVFCNYGCEIKTLLPEHILNSTQDYSNFIIRQETDLGVPVGGHYSLRNLHLVLNILAQALHARPRYGNEELQDLLIILCHVAMDKSHHSEILPHEFQVCFRGVLRSFTSNFWEQNCNELCHAVYKVTTHHHNRLHLIQLFPEDKRGGYLQKRVAFLCLQDMFNISKDVSIKDFKPKCLHVFLTKLHSLVLDDVYKLSSAISYLDVAVGNSAIKISEKEDLQYLCDQLKKISGDVKDSVRMLDRSWVKDMMVRVCSKWTLYLLSVGSKQKSMFAYTKKKPAIAIKTVEASQGNDSSQSDEETEKQNSSNINDNQTKSSVNYQGMELVDENSNQSDSKLTTFSDDNPDNDKPKIKMEKPDIIAIADCATPMEVDLTTEDDLPDLLDHS